MRLAAAGMAAAIVLGGLPRAFAVMPQRDQAGDARRFGLDAPEAAWKHPAPASPRAARARLKSLSASGVRARYGPQGGVSGLAGKLTGSSSGGPRAAVANFLAQNRDLLGIDPAALVLDHSQRSGDVTHLLYRQTYQGLPVEFARVKAHVSDAGEVLGYDSGYIAGLSGTPNPSISQAQAAAAVQADLGRPPSGPGALVYLPVYKTGEVRLAWKFKVQSRGAKWFYYVDAQTGAVLFRYNDLRFACQTSGRVFGRVYDIDPSSGPLKVRPMPDENIYVFNNAAATFAVSDGTGSFCSQTAGKIYASLQGPNANVSNFNAAAAHYDNGGGTWFTAATPIATPNPYPAGTASPNSVVFSATINSPTPPVGQFGAGAKVVAALPVFSFFNVGSVDQAFGFVSRDDQAQITDAAGNPIASYIGNKSPFNGAGVLGLQPSMGLRLVAAPGDRGPGFSVDISSFLVLTNNPAVAAADSSFLWTSTMTYDGTTDEINAFYHINKMHDYFLADIDKSSVAAISVPMVAMVHAGPNLANAFYNPDYDNLTFGDVAPFALDATVVRHEYTHFVVNKIYPVVNFGQYGAISEAVADYFSASSLNDANIGGGVGGAFGSEGSLRNLACNHATGSPPCIVFPTNWSGEIHDDSLPLSQSLWDLRSDPTVGQACADELAFQSLFYFPDSFQEFLDAMLQVDARAMTLAPLCGAANAARGAILTAFNPHGINLATAGGDVYEPNDGTESATDISTLSVITATIFPAADIDNYTFGAAKGLIQAALTLPVNQSIQGTYFAYSMLLLDRKLNIVAEADPPIDVNPTPNGGCPGGTCLTTSHSVRLAYNNPSPNQFYLVVSAAPDDNGSNGTTNSVSPYSLSINYPRPGGLVASIVTASFDNDTFSFAVNVSTFVTFQNYSFDHAQLRDQSQNVLSQTATNGTAPFLTMVSSVSTAGKITGTLKLTPGFSGRFPSVGTVYLEIFGVDRLQAANCDPAVNPGAACLSQSLGVSNPLQLTAAQSSLSAWNNIFNPAQGQKATFKYEITQSGRVTLRLYTVNGNLVATLIDQDMPPGKGSVDWFGQNSGGKTVASGLYLLYLKAPGINQTQKVIVVK